MKAEMYNHQQWITETDPSVLFEMFNGLLLNCGFTVLGFMEHHFDPQGWTGLWLLAESHFALHTFPEEGKTYLELSSCNEMKQIMFVDGLNR